MTAGEAHPPATLGWGRSLAVSALVLALLAVAAALWVGGRPSRAYAPGGVVLSGSDYRFAPSRLTWRPGQRVTLTFTNDSSGVPGKPHELMIGRVPVTRQTPFGPRFTGGFQTDFFEGVEVQVLEADKLTMLMPGDALVSGADMSGMEMGAGGQPAEAGFMLQLAPGGRTTIRFAVPDKPGTWQFGCFAQSGQHWENGMQGQVTVERA